jgi:outer membrane protein W
MQKGCDHYDRDPFLFSLRLIKMCYLTKFGIVSIIMLAWFPGLSTAQFLSGSSVLGAHIGVSNVARATVLGVKFEEGFTEAGPGTIGGSAKVDYYSWNADGGVIQTYFFITVSGNYHLKLDDSPNFDPFAGVGFGYLYETNKYPTSGFYYYDHVGSGFNVVLSIGARYYLSPGFALRLELGTSQVYAVGGFDFGF